MTSKDDDTLPLPGLSEELSVDATVDEDFIPTSQPQSSGSPKLSKDSESSFNKSTEELKCSISDSRIDDTLPPEAVMNQSESDKNKSADFIPDTETKKMKMSYATAEVSCKKKLAVFGGENIFRAQSNPLWESEAAQIPESPALETENISILNDTPTEKTRNPSETVEKCEESITEIIVNDSAETVDFDSTPVKIKISDSEKAVEIFEISNSCSSSGEKCEETQIFDNSSVLLLDPQGAGCSVLEKSEEISGVTSEKLYMQETLVEKEMKSEGKVNGFASVSSPPYAVAEALEATDPIENGVDVCPQNVFPKQEECHKKYEQQRERRKRKMRNKEGKEKCEKLNEKKDEWDGGKESEEKVKEEELQQSSTGQELNSGSIVTRKIDINLTVSCFVTFNTKTNKVLQKIILNVNETPKPKPKPVYLEPASDNASDKSKRYSTSSSGSVYSDKMGPFALPKRVSVISDQTDSSEDDFALIRTKEKRALERVPWSNEYLLPLKMDDLIHLSIENQELLKRPNIISPRKMKSKNYNGVHHLKEILESSTSEQTSECNLGSGEVPSSRTNSRETTNYEETVGKETHETSEAVLSEEEETIKENPNASETNPKPVTPEGDSKPSPKLVETETKQPEDDTKVAEKEAEEESSSVSLCDGLAVFARWALDKRYYSGVLCGSVKNERWEVQFDDGTRKNVREDFIMPAAWLKVGALVFAMTDEKYESGQIVDVQRGKEVEYVVELDSEKKEVRVKISDLCLTDVMAGIVREKYKPLVETPRAKADIDFDNVLSGKRSREQRTPLRPPAVPAGSSGAKKKSSSKAKKDDSRNMQSIKETPEDDTGKKRGGLKSENGHLVEDKVISTDSRSGTEAAETPHRKAAKDTRKKAKPRSLSYEAEESRSGKKKWSSWLAPDGTPIPGPSGVKAKKQKTKAKAKAADTSDSETESAAAASKSYTTRSRAVQSAEKSKRKRKLDESVEGSAQKKSLQEDENRMKTRTKRG